jgi:hypothetical protein
LQSISVLLSSTSTKTSWPVHTKAKCNNKIYSTATDVYEPQEDAQEDAFQHLSKGSSSNAKTLEPRIHHKINQLPIGNPKVIETMPTIMDKLASSAKCRTTDWRIAE